MPEAQPLIDARIEAMDTGLFDAIASQSTAEDRKSWLAVQRAIRRGGGYCYLEIGSHLGGSIQQHLVDPRCTGIVSIDKRPARQPDDRGQVYEYEDNSTARMLENLRRVAPGDVVKVVCFDADARDLESRSIAAPPDFCFIDGEHTAGAVRSDFGFCLRVCALNAAICFHDDFVIHRALRAIVSELRRQGVPYAARKLPGSTFAIFLRDCPARNDRYVQEQGAKGERWLARQRLLQWVPLWLRRSVGRVVDWLRERRPGA